MVVWAFLKPVRDLVEIQNMECDIWETEILTT